MKTLRIRLSGIVIIGLITLASSSCHLLYLPNQVNVPMLTGKNDLSGNISLGLSNVNVQAAFSPINHVGFMANYAGGKTSSSDDTSITNSYYFFEIGLGYYKPINKSILFDVFGGYGIGDSRTYDNVWDNPTTINGKYTRIFVQPSLTISASEAFDANLAIRPVFVFMGKSGSGTTPSRSSNTFLEPVLTLKYGWKYVKIINQFGLSLPIQGAEYAFNPFILGIGINFQLKSSWLEKDKKQE